MNIEQIKAQVAEWEVWYKSSPPAPDIIQAVKQLMAENERLEKELQIQDYANEILETENKRLKTTLKGTQTVLAGTMMAFADKQPE